MIEITHVAEFLIAEMYNRSPSVQRGLFEIMGQKNAWFNEQFAVPELQLSTCGSYIFDGAHKIDVAILNTRTNLVIPCEAKLGLNRLNRSQFESRFLKQGGLSHGNRRIKGSMLAIIERKLPEGCLTEPIHVYHDGIDYELSSKWFLIIRHQILKSWRKSGKPRLSENCVIVTIEQIIEFFGGRKAFNVLVKEVLDFDYYSRWLGDA